MRRWDGLVEGYIAQCEARGLVTTTLAQRRRELERFGSWLKRQKPRIALEGVEGVLIIKYVRARTTCKSRSMVFGTVSILRGMGGYLEAQGIWLKNPLRWIRGPKLDPRMRLPRRIGKEHLQKLWRGVEEQRSVYRRHLGLSLLAILYGTGLRRGELERLDVDDWDRENGVLKIDGRKTGQERKVPVGAGVWRCLEAYLPHRQNRLERWARVGEPALFVNRNGARLKGDAITRLIQRFALQAVVPLVSLHQFRHTCASDLLEAGVSLPEVRKVMGHAWIGTTMRYIQVAGPERVAAMAKHPLNEWLTEAEETRRVAG